MPSRTAWFCVGILVASSASAWGCAFHTHGFGSGGTDPGTTTDTGNSTSSSSASSSSSSSASSSSSSSSSSSGAPVVCGDGMKDVTEECEDGNTVAGDGCGPTCLTEHPEVCPGTPIAIAAGETLSIKGDTTNASDKFADAPSNKGNCVNGNYPGPDLIYAVTTTAAGALTVSLNATYDRPYVHVRTQCPGSKAEEIACQYSQGSGVNSVAIPASAGATYYVAADSWDGNAGPFTLVLVLAAQ